DATDLIERQLDAMARTLDAVLPTDGGARPEPVPEAAPVKPSGTRRILVADDSAAVCESFAAILRDLGHEVRTVQNGVEAVDEATAWMPDFVMLDVNMPKLNG